MPQTYLYLTLSGYETTSHFFNIVNTSTVVLYMGMKLYPTYYIVTVCVKLIKLPSMLSTDMGFVGSSGLKWLSPSMFCPTCRWFIHILRVLVGSGPWSGRFGSFLPYLYIWSPPRPSAKSWMAMQQVSDDRNGILPFPPPNFCLSGSVQEIGWWPEHNQGWVGSFFVSCFWG